APCWDDPAERQREIMQVYRTRRPQLESRERALEECGDCWFRVDKIPTTDECGKVDGVMVVISDITQSVRRELALKESEARYRAYIANSPDAIWRYDICPPINTRLPIEQQVDLILKRAVLAECNEKLVRLYGVGSASHL